MEILLSAIVYSGLVMITSTFGMVTSQQLYTLLPLPFALAIFIFSSLGLKLLTEARVVRTIIVLTVLLLLGTSSSFIKLCFIVLKFENQFPPIILFHAIVFLLSFFHIMLIFILLKRRTLQ